MKRASRPCALPCLDRSRCRPVHRAGLAAPRAESQKASDSAQPQQLTAGERAILTEMRQMGTEIRNEMQEMCTGLRTEMRGVRKEMGGMQAILGNLHEAQKRAAIAQLFGE